MFGIGLPELIVIAVLALLIIGPKDLPKMARELGRTVRSIRRTAEDFKSEIRREVDKVGPSEQDGPGDKISPFEGPRRKEDR